MIKIMDFIISTVYKFLFLIGKREISVLKSVCIKASAMILFLFTGTILGIGYMWLINKSVVTYSRTPYFLLSIALFILLYSLIKKKYLETLEQVVKEYEVKFGFKNWQIICLFIILWFGSLTLFGGSLLYFRTLWYNM